MNSMPFFFVETTTDKAKRIPAISKHIPTPYALLFNIKRNTLI